MKKNYLYNLLLTVFNLLVPVISFPYVARVLGPEGVGKAQFILSFSQYLSLLAALGVPIYGIREIARVRHDKVLLRRTFTELLLINCGAGMLCCAAYTALVLYHPFFRPDVLLYAGAGLLILLSFTSVEWFYVGMESFRQIALRSILVKSAALVLIFLCIRKPTDAAGYLFLSLGAILANNLLNIWCARRHIQLSTAGLQTRRHLRPLFYIFGTTVASTLYTTFDAVILGFLAGNKQVGLYAAATKSTKFGIPLVIAYGGVLLPGITQSFQKNDVGQRQTLLQQSYAYTVLLAVPLAVGLFVFAPSMMMLFSGPAFMEAVPAMRIMAFLPLLVGLGYFWGYQVIIPSGNDKMLLVSAAGGMVISLLLNFLLVPQLHATGAAIANVAAELIVTAGYFLLIRRVVAVKVRLAALPEALFAATPFLLGLLLPRTYIWGSELLSLACSGIACVIIYGSAQLFVFKNAFLWAWIKQYKTRHTSAENSV